MKTADSQTHSQQHRADQSTSSAQGLESAFFSERSPNPAPFFPSGTTLGVQTKPLHNIQPFFQPGRTPALQLKCAGCEAEQDDSPTVQRMPAFESDAEAPMVQPKRLVQRQAESLEPEAEESTAEEADLSDKMASQGGASDDAGDSNQPAFSFAQMKLTIGRPNDPFEQEADAVADQVVSQPKQQEHLAAGIQTKPLEKVISRLPSHPTIAIPYKRSPKRIQKQEGQPATASDDVANRLSSSQGGGRSLDDNTRGEMESSFGADFSQVRVHTGGEATQLSQDLGAKAFTHGSDIYFNEGQYSPSSSDGKHLLAHELTHTVQQGAAVQRKPKGVSQSHIPDVQAGFFDDVGGAIGSAAGSVASAAGSVANAGAGLVGLSIEDLREMLAEFADDKLPVYSLLSVAIEYDVLRGKRVERTRENIIKGVFSLINPLGSILRKRLEERGIIDQVFEWIDSELTRLGLTIGDIKAKLSQFLDGVILATTSPIDDNIDLFKRTFGAIFSSIGTFIKNVGNKVYAMIKQAFLKLLGELAKQIGGYDLLADLLGEDPITGEARNAGTADILRGILKLPVIQAIGGDKLLKKLEELKLIDKTAEWIDGQWALLKKGFNSLLSIADKFLSLFTLSLEVLTNPLKIVNEIKTEVVGFVSTVISFFRNLASKALEIVKEAMIWLVNKFVDKNSPAWDLAVFVLGQNPLTGEKVPRNYLKLIGAFLKLLPGGDALYQKFIETGALQRMVGWIQNAIQKFIAILLGMKDAFVNMWQVVTINALLNPIGFFTEVVNLFKKPVLRLVAFVKNVLVKLFEVLMGLMKLPVEVAKAIIANVVKAFNDIRKDPIKFLLNLLKAVKQGFVQFFDNIGKHLLAGVTGWMFGQLAKTGITIPQKLDVASILDLVMQVLNLTIDNLWARLAKRIGQDKVDKIKGSIDKLVGIWTFVTDVVKNGIAAIWKYIQAKISGLWDMILEKAKNWIVITIIEKVTTKLLTMLDPTGIMAVINGFIAFYKAIESFIEKINEMLQIAASFVKGMAAIARGTVAKAADYLEFSLASALPVALSFLANQIGLGGIGDKIKEIIQTVQGFINKGIDWLIEKAIKAMKSIVGIFTRKKGEQSKDRRGENETGEVEITAEDREKHQQITEKIKQELLKPPSKKPRNFDEFYKEKTDKAKKLEKIYQAKIKDGIKLDINFKELKEEKVDQDIDFHIIIAPNTEEEEFTARYSLEGINEEVVATIKPYVYGKLGGGGSPIITMMEAFAAGTPGSLDQRVSTRVIRRTIETIEGENEVLMLRFVELVGGTVHFEKLDQMKASLNNLKDEHNLNATTISLIKTLIKHREEAIEWIEGLHREFTGGSLWIFNLSALDQIDHLENLLSFIHPLPDWAKGEEKVFLKTFSNVRTDERITRDQVHRLGGIRDAINKGRRLANRISGREDNEISPTERQDLIGYRQVLEGTNLDAITQLLNDIPAAHDKPNELNSARENVLRAINDLPDLAI